MTETSALAEGPYKFYDELFGTLNQVPEQDQGKVFKAFLLNGIDTLSEHMSLQLDLLEKLGSLALDNVQDVRLYSLEASVRELEQGKPITFGAIVGELFFTIALEGVVLAGMTAAAPVLATSGALLITALRSSVRSPVMTRRVQMFKAVDQHREELFANEHRLMSRLHPRLNREQKRRLGLFEEERKVKQELETLHASLEQVNRQYEFAIEQIGEASNLRTSNAFGARYASILDIRFSKGIERVINDYAQHVDAGKSVARSFATVARQQYPQAFAALNAGDAGQARRATHDGFTTTHSVLQLIEECESMKLDVTLHYRQLRNALDVVDADEIFEAVETLLVMEELEHNLFDTTGLTEDMLENLQHFVIPMELAIWLTYLESNNVLARESAAVRRTAYLHGQLKETTRFIANDLVENIVYTTRGVTDTPRTVYEGRRYEGLHVLEEHQAYYLFHKFAKHAFDAFAAQIPISKAKELGDFIRKDVRANAFADVLSLPKTSFWQGDNPERANLVKEMSVVVIEYFIYVRQRLASQQTLGFSDAVPAGTAISTLLNLIDRSVHPEQQPQVGPPLPPELFLEQQADVLLDEWEVRVLTMLADREYDYDLALSEYLRALSTREEFDGQLPPDFIEDFIVEQATARLCASRSMLEKSVGLVKFDEQKRTTADVEAAIERLEHKTADCPVEGEMFDRLPQ